MPDITYPYSSFRFRVEFDGTESAGFSEVSGGDISVDVIEYREGFDPRNTPRKLAGLTKYGNITLKWGVIGGFGMRDWIESVMSNNSKGMDGIVRKTILIKSMDVKGGDGPWWEVINAWPCHYTGPDFNALSSEVAVETLEIAHEGIQRYDGGDNDTPSSV
jgi:phage tail-like protein